MNEELGCTAGIVGALTLSMLALKLSGLVNWPWAALLLPLFGVMIGWGLASLVIILKDETHSK